MGMDIVFRGVNLRREGADIRVCRPSRWGNPWRIQIQQSSGRYKIWCPAGRGIRRWQSDCVFTRDEAHAVAVANYRSWILERPELVTALLREINDRGARAGWLARNPCEVRLGCWCKPLPCHVDVLAELLTERLLTT